MKITEILSEMRDRRDAYQRDYDSSVSGMGKHDSYAYRMDGGANDEGWDKEDDFRPNRGGFRSSRPGLQDTPHDVYIDGRKWKTFDSHSHANNVAKKLQAKGKNATVKRSLEESALKDKDDLKAKRKALQDIQMDPATSKDPQLKKELVQRKAALEKEAKEKGLDENATAGATSAANVGTVVNPHHSPGKARGKKSYLGSPSTGSGTKAPPQPKVVQPKTKSGTAVNGLDIKGASLFGGPPQKR